MALLQLVLTLCVVFSALASSEQFGYRRDVKHLTKQEKEEIKSALYEMKIQPSRYNSSLSSYDYFPYVHAVSVRIVKSHQTWAFLPWHRAFVHFFEKELNYFMNRAEDNPFKLPYWNPNDDESTEQTLFDTDFLGGTGDPNSNPPYLVPDDYAFGGVDKFPVHNGFGLLTVDPALSANSANASTYNYPSLSRWIFQGSTDSNNNVCGTQTDDQSVWDALNGVEEYDVAPYNNTESAWDTSHCARSFRAQLEGCNPRNASECSIAHSTLHRIVGGHQMQIPWSPNDPLFFMLHGYVDLAWAVWQDIHDKQFDNFPQHVLDEALFYFADFNDDGMSARDVLDTRELFYKYDVQLASEYKKWYEDFTKAWIYLFMVGIVMVLVAFAFAVYCKKTKDRQQEALGSYQNVEDNGYGTTEAQQANRV